MNPDKSRWFYRAWSGLLFVLMTLLQALHHGPASGAKRRVTG